MAAPTTIDQRLSFFPTAHNECIRTLIVARLVSARRLAPRGHRMAPAGGLSFAAAMRMVDRVHRNTAVMRALAHPARPAGLTDRHVLVIDVANLSDRRQTIEQHLARLARR